MSLLVKQVKHASWTLMTVIAHLDFDGRSKV